MTHKAVYWGNPVRNVHGGETFDAAVSLDVFWIDTRELIRDASGEQMVSNAQVLVQQELEEGGYLYRGNLSALTVQERAHPANVRGASEIRKFDDYTGFSGLKVYVAWL